MTATTSIEDFQGGVDTIDLTAVDDVDSFGDLDLTDLGSSVRSTTAPAPSCSTA